MICLRHRSASGDLSNSWEFAPDDRSILCSIRQGRVSVSFRVEVCAPARLAFGAHPITRLDGETWRVVAERVIRTWPNRREQLETIRCPINGAIGYLALALTNAPAEVSQVLEAL